MIAKDHKIAVNQSAKLRTVSLHLSHLEKFKWWSSDKSTQFTSGEWQKIPGQRDWTTHHMKKTWPDNPKICPHISSGISDLSGSFPFLSSDSLHAPWNVHCFDSQQSTERWKTNIANVEFLAHWVDLPKEMFFVLHGVFKLENCEITSRRICDQKKEVIAGFLISSLIPVSFLSGLLSFAPTTLFSRNQLFETPQSRRWLQ